MKPARAGQRDSGKEPAVVNVPKGLLFDCGDTVMRLDELDIARGGTRLFELADNPRAATPAQMLELIARLQKDWQSRVEESMLEFSFLALWRHATARLGLILAVEEAEIERIFWDAAARASPEPGIERALDAADRRGLPCAILSNSIFTERTSVSTTIVVFPT